MKTTMDVKRPVVRYHGGKWRLAPWIVGNFPTHRIFVSGCGGGGSVLMRKERSYSEVYNDKWGLIVNVFRVIRDHGDEFKAYIENIPYSRAEFEFCTPDNINNLLATDPVKAAAYSVYRSFCSFGSAGIDPGYSTGFRAISNRSHTTPAHDWKNYPERIPEFTERLKGVVIENRDVFKIHPQHDSAETLHYLDPPYLRETRNSNGTQYAIESDSEEFHRNLAAMANGLNGMVCISGYKSGLYDEIYKGWRTEEMQTRADGNRKRTEVLWMNYDPPVKCRQYTLKL